MRETCRKVEIILTLQKEMCRSHEMDKETRNCFMHVQSGPLAQKVNPAVVESINLEELNLEAQCGIGRDDGRESTCTVRLQMS